MFKVSLGKKLARTPSQPINLAWLYTSIMPVTWGAEVEGSYLRSAPCKKQETLPKKELK
jgi:hypothetical protein